MRNRSAVAQPAIFMDEEADACMLLSVGSEDIWIPQAQQKHDADITSWMRWNWGR